MALYKCCIIYYYKSFYTTAVRHVFLLLELNYVVVLLDLGRDLNTPDIVFSVFMVQIVPQMHSFPLKRRTRNRYEILGTRLVISGLVRYTAAM